MLQYNCPRWDGNDVVNVRNLKEGGFFMLKEFRKKEKEKKVGKLMGQRMAISKLVQTTVDLFVMFSMPQWNVKSFRELHVIKTKIISFISESDEMKMVLEEITEQKKRVDSLIELFIKQFTPEWVSDILKDPVKILVEEQQDLLDAAYEEGDIK